MSKRTATITRDTKETSVSLEINLDGSGKSSIDTGIPFFNHMLELLTYHSEFDISIQSKGDIDVDFHHTVEDIGICLGQCFKEALKDGKGIARYASGLIPMDEALCQIAIDISNRPHLNFNCNFPKTKVGSFDIELAEEFFNAFCTNARITLHISLLSGTNLHHMIEACFKAFGIHLNKATSIQTNRIPSTKGLL